MDIRTIKNEKDVDATLNIRNTVGQKLPVMLHKFGLFFLKIKHNCTFYVVMCNFISLKTFEYTSILFYSLKICLFFISLKSV